MSTKTSGSEKRVMRAMLCCAAEADAPIRLDNADRMPAEDQDRDDDQGCESDSALPVEVKEAEDVEGEVTAGGELTQTNPEWSKSLTSDDAMAAEQEDSGEGTRKVRKSVFATESGLNEHIAKARQSMRHVKGRASVRASSVTQLHDLYYTKKKSYIRFRWNLLWSFLVLLGLYPLLAIVPSACKGVYATTLTLTLFQAGLLTVGAISCWLYMLRSWWSTKVSWVSLAKDRFGETEVNRVRHVFVLPAYKEPLALLENTVSTIAAQTLAKNIIMVVTLEESSPTLREAKERLPRLYGDSFAKIIVTMHPKGLENEIPGACSNRNWGVRRAVQVLETEFTPHDDATLVTVCDSDTVFHPRYAACLTYKFLAADDRVNRVYQSPLFYNLSLDQRYFFTRVTAFIRAFLMIGFLIPMSINTMSIYSIPLGLLKRAKFFHPGYQMDDIIFTLSAMQAIGKRVIIELIDVPTLSGPTSGESFFEELMEWYVQAKRWTIGAGEVFHYFIVKMLRRRFTFWAGLSYGFWLTTYYAFFLCAGGIVTLLHTVVRVAFAVSDPQHGLEACLQDSFWDFGVPVQNIELCITIYTYLVFFGTAFALDRRLVNVLELEEKFDSLRSLVTFLLAQVVLWGYCLVELWSIGILAIHGKKVCGHKPSNKDNLVNKSVPKEGGGEVNVGMKLDM